MQKHWYNQGDVEGNLVGEWARGPDLHLKRSKPLVGRVFWRDAGITSFGVSNCATIAVCGGDDTNSSTRDVQLLVRQNQNWEWINKGNNTTKIPSDVLTLALPVSHGAFGTEQWPEILVTGGRPILFGGMPPLDSSSGSTQFAQLRFTKGRLRRDIHITPDPNGFDTAWNITTYMPNQRTNFRAVPLSQKNSASFGKRVSRFLCVGGRDKTSVSNATQLFQLPVPSPFISINKQK